MLKATFRHRKSQSVQIPKEGFKFKLKRLLSNLLLTKDGKGLLTLFQMKKKKEENCGIKGCLKRRENKKY